MQNFLYWRRVTVFTGMWNASSHLIRDGPDAQVRREKVTNRADGRQLLRGWWLRVRRMGKGTMGGLSVRRLQKQPIYRCRQAANVHVRRFFFLFFSLRLQCPRGRREAKPWTTSPSGTRRRYCACYARWAKFVASWITNDDRFRTLLSYFVKVYI